jgi:hypothetical protein
MEFRERIPTILVIVGILWLAITTMYLKGRAETPDALTVLSLFGTGFAILLVGVFKLLALKREMAELEERARTNASRERAP